MSDEPEQQQPDEQPERSVIVPRGRRIWLLRSLERTEAEGELQEDGNDG